MSPTLRVRSCDQVSITCTSALPHSALLTRIISSSGSIGGSSGSRGSIGGSIGRSIGLDQFGSVIDLRSPS